jgi:hypothetical protein
MGVRTPFGRAAIKPPFQSQFTLHFVSDFLMFYLSNRPGLLIISLSFMEASKHFTFQTKWMAEKLVSCAMENLVYQGGLLLDLTYWFFENK